MKAILADTGKANAAEVRQVRFLFGILKKGGKVYTKVITDTKAKILMGIMQKQIKPDSIVYIDHYRSY